MINRSRLEAILSTVVDVQRHETSALLHSSSCFFFILSAYFVVLPLRDEGAISLGLSHLPGLFVGSLVLTLIAAPVSTLIFSLPNLSKARALVLIHRFFSVSLIAFFILWHSSSTGYSTSNWKDSISGSSIAEQVPTVDGNQGSNASSSGWGAHSWFYISVRIGLFLWIALFNLITISSTWARVIDVMDTEVHVFTYKLSELFDLIACLTFLYNQSGSRLFGFIGAGATLGQLFGSLFATGMAWLGSFLLLFAALLMELAAQSSKGICEDVSCLVEEQSFTVESETDQHHGKYSSRCKGSSLRPNSSSMKPQIWTLLDGLWLILSSTYLIYVSLFLWMSAVVSSFFYFQKVSIIAMSATSAVGRRKLFAQINSFIAVFIFAGQITLTGRILTVAGITIAICASPLVAVLNLITLAVWPSWIVVAISETLRKVVTYVVTRPGRELLFTVVSQEEKYKAKVCIDVIVQRLGDATAAGMFELLVGTLNGKTSTVSLYALPACLLWMITALHLGRQHQQRIKLLDVAGHLENSVREGCR